MKLIADSGSTKTAWVILDKKDNKTSVKKEFLTQGFNPYYQTKEQIKTELKENVLTNCRDFWVEEIYFYGAGCTEEKKNIIKESLVAFFPTAKTIEVHSDLLASARAMCQVPKIKWNGCGTWNGF